MSLTKDDRMGPHSLRNCLGICTAPSTSEPIPTWILLCYKIVLKKPLLLVFGVCFLIAMQAFRGK